MRIPFLVLLCSNIGAALRIRRDIASYSYQEKSDLTLRMNLLKSGGLYDELSELHGDRGVFDAVHHSDFFLPWHRWFLWVAETALRDVMPTDQDFTLPYWNSTRHADDIDAAPIWSTDFLGPRTGDPLQDWCLSEGWVSYWTSRAGLCISRKGENNSKLTPWNEIAPWITTPSTNFSELSERIERGPHDSVHTRIGGTLKTRPSPDDPLFWLHHAYIDKLWFMHQEGDPTGPLPGRLPNTSVLVSDVWLAASLGYAYA